MASRRRKNDIAAWMPNRIDATIDRVTPLPGWVLLEEVFENEVTLGKVTLALARPGVTNTVAAKVIGVSAEDQSSFGIRVGDKIVLREWQGSRWDFEGSVALLTNVEHVLAKIS